MDQAVKIMLILTFPDFQEVSNSSGVDRIAVINILLILIPINEANTHKLAK
tara:strand:- start:401 stop:553 length:153 start_codon:yes stop_codon:yes gene_type:complete